MVQQIVGAVIAVAIALAACFAYFWGTNWLLDKFLATNNSMPVATATARDLRRSNIRPWLFLVPALFFLVVYLVYPVIETVRL
jgi:alpha-glucoside transport system permease protein